MTPDPKKPRRIVDKQAWKRAVRREPECVICGKPTQSSHHLLKRSQAGDDFPPNLVGVCGDGVRGCHGRLEAEDVVTRKLLGEYVMERRRDFTAYLEAKLGAEQSREWLRRRLLVE